MNSISIRLSNNKKLVNEISDKFLSTFDRKATVTISLATYSRVNDFDFLKYLNVLENDSCLYDQTKNQLELLLQKNEFRIIFEHKNH